ncbi:MAG: hypothetical protein ACJAW3_001356 [Lentimonas sp.]|jgi:hypothetical protein
MFHKIATIFSLLLFSSCVFLTENTLIQSANENSFLNRFPDNFKSILILKINGNRRDRIYLCQVNDYSQRRSNKCKTLYATNKYQILMIAPKEYYLFAPPKRDPLFVDKKTSNQLRKYFAKLDLNAQEITYSGELSYNKAVRISDQKTSNSQENGKSGKKISKDKLEEIQKIIEEDNEKEIKKLLSNQPLEIRHLIKNYPQLKKYLVTKLLIE